MYKVYKDEPLNSFKIYTGCVGYFVFYNYALNTEFVAVVDMLRKKLNRHSKAETISKLTILT